MNLGAHMSIAGGIDRALDRGKKSECSVVQIFTKNQSQWAARPLDDVEIERFRSLKQKFFSVFAHSSYLINLASPDTILSAKSIRALADELKRCSTLEIGKLVVHPGSYITGNETDGVHRIAASIKKVFDIFTEGNVAILLETTAGQGTSLGYRFEHLRDILAETEQYSELLGICIDTCHIFAAGYNFSTPSLYNELKKHFISTVGLSKLGAIHINDSKKGLGSRIDRHEHIGKGMIGLESFRNILTDPDLRNIPMCLETPKGKDMEEDRTNLSVLRELRSH